MERIHKFLHLSARDRCLLVKSALLLGTIRLGLWLLPFHTLQRLLARIAQTTTKLQEADEVSVDNVVWAVVVASRYIPGVKCLACALATQVLLKWCGYSACLSIGVAKGEAGQLEAHAWVESQRRLVIGGLADLSRYTPLSFLK